MKRLFYSSSTRRVISVLISRYRGNGIAFELHDRILDIRGSSANFALRLGNVAINYRGLIVTANKLSVPKLNTSPFNCGVTRRFNLGILPAHTNLIPFALRGPLLRRLRILTNITIPSIVATRGNAIFHRGLLFARHNLSKPTILRVSDC